jgi:hypothetical protein
MSARPLEIAAVLAAVKDAPMARREAVAAQSLTAAALGAVESCGRDEETSLSRTKKRTCLVGGG